MIVKNENLEVITSDFVRVNHFIWLMISKSMIGKVTFTQVTSRNNALGKGKVHHSKGRPRENWENWTMNVWVDETFHFRHLKVMSSNPFTQKKGVDIH